MMYNQQLYRQYKQSRFKKENKKLTKMNQMVADFPDQQIVTLESSIPLMRQLGVVEEIKNVEHIVVLMENRKNEGISWDTDERQLWQCRLIYFMWHIIGHEQIEMKDFKELIILLTSEQRDRSQQISTIYGYRQQIGELLQTWDRLLLQNSSPSPKINDISIIKTKNQGSFGSNKENILAQSNVYTPSIRNSFDPKSSRQINSRIRLQKSYTKKSVKTTLDRSSSTSRVNSKRSENCSSSNFVPAIHQINFFSATETLTPDDERKLVDRLYDYSKYQTRQQKKKQIEQQRIKVQLNKCTFKPQINKVVGCQKQLTKEIKGFNRAIDRMKQGYQKKNQLKENLQFRSSKQLPAMSSQLTQCNPPKFHAKTKRQQKPELFELKFSLGRMTIPIKVRQSDSLEQLVNHVGRIYSLKKHQKQYIRQSIIASLKQYKQTFLRNLELQQS